MNENEIWKIKMVIFDDSVFASCMNELKEKLLLKATCLQFELYLSV